MNKNRVWGIIIISIWLLVFFGSTGAILRLTGYLLERKSPESFPNSTLLHFNIERFTNPEGILNLIRFEGWAFAENYQPNTSKTVSLIFISEHDMYEIESTPYSRPDVPAAFKEFDLTSEDLGFNGIFSTIGIKNGVYELLLKTSENGNITEISRTNKLYMKSNKDFFLIEPDKESP